MKTITLNLISSFKHLWLGLLAVGLIGVVTNASAQVGFDVTYEGTLSFKGKIVSQCPELSPGDTAAFSISRSFGDGIPRPRSKFTLWSGEITTVTSRGVSIVARGRLVGDTTQATLYITDLSVGDSCYFTGLKLNVSMRAN